MAKKLAASSSSKARGLRLFGPPPLLAGEDAAGYDELLARISSAVKPSDVIEEIWVRDIVDLSWEVFRWHRLKKEVLEMLSGTRAASSAYMALLEKVVLLERLTTIAETRRNAALRELERRRTALALTLRNRLPHVEDTELESIEPKLIASSAATNNAA
jgi:hypothetical protein